MVIDRSFESVAALGEAFIIRGRLDTSPEVRPDPTVTFVLTVAMPWSCLCESQRRTAISNPRETSGSFSPTRVDR